MRRGLLLRYCLVIAAIFLFAFAYGCGGCGGCGEENRGAPEEEVSESNVEGGPSEAGVVEDEGSCTEDADCNEGFLCGVDGKCVAAPPAGAGGGVVTGRARAGSGGGPEAAPKEVPEGAGEGQGGEPPIKILTVLSTTPRDGVSDIPINSSFSITFGEDVDESSLNGALTLTGGTKDGVTYDVIYNKETKTATFEPKSLLSYSITYTAEIKGVKNAAGDTILEDYRWNFATWRQPLIAKGRYHTIAVRRSDGTVWAWGDNRYAQLGDGTKNTSLIPVKVRDPSNVSGDNAGFLTGVFAVVGGNLHTVALKGNGTVWAWGLNNVGQLGDGTKIDKTTAVQVKNADGTGFLGDVVAVAAGGVHTLAIKKDGTLWAWGYNFGGELGIGNTDPNFALPQQITDSDGDGFLADVVAVAGGEYHTVALQRDGSVWTWGRNYYGQLGHETTDDCPWGYNTNLASGCNLRPGKVTIPSSAKAIAISSGMNYTVTLLDDGTVWAWGYNTVGELGDGTTQWRYSPVQVCLNFNVQTRSCTAYLTGIVAIAAGRDHTLALDKDGTVWAWGINDCGQLGVNKGYNQLYLSQTPVKVVGPDGVGFLSNIVAVAAGSWSTVALNENGEIYEWGDNTTDWGGNCFRRGDCDILPILASGGFNF